MDFGSIAADPRVDQTARGAFDRAVQAHNALLTERHTFDVHYGRRVTGDLEDAGLTDVGCEGRAAMWRGGATGGVVWRHTFVQLREPLIAGGPAGASHVDRAIALCDDPAFSFVSQIVMASRGRRP
jgi:hypothetical protein